MEDALFASTPSAVHPERVEVGELSYHWTEVVAGSASETGREGETQWAPIRDMVEPWVRR